MEMFEHNLTSVSFCLLSFSSVDFFLCIPGMALVSGLPPMSVIFQQQPHITTLHLFDECLWSHVIWFSLHCPSVDGSWWGLREPSLLFSGEHVPKQHLALPHSQTRWLAHTHMHTHTLYLSSSVCPAVLGPTICPSASILLNLAAACCLLIKISAV